MHAVTTVSAIKCGAGLWLQVHACSATVALRVNTTDSCGLRLRPWTKERYRGRCHGPPKSSGRWAMATAMDFTAFTASHVSLAPRLRVPTGRIHARPAHSSADPGSRIGLGPRPLVWNSGKETVEHYEGPEHGRACALVRQSAAPSHSTSATPIGSFRHSPSPFGPPIDVL